MTSTYYRHFLPWLPKNERWQTSPISFLWNFLNSRLDSWNQFLLSKFIIKKKKKFCKLHIEIGKFWRGRYLLKRRWLGFNSLHYSYKSKFDFFFLLGATQPPICQVPQIHNLREKETSTHTYNCTYKGYHHYISWKETEFPATNSTALCRTDVTYCAMGNNEIKQPSVFRGLYYQENNFYYQTKMVY